MSKKHFIELRDEGGIVTVIQVQLDGFTTIHRSLLYELLETSKFSYREVGQ